MSSSVKITGLAQMKAAIGGLPLKMQESIATGALRAGAEIVAEQARANAPVAPPSFRNRKRYGLVAGDLRDSIRVTRGTLTNGVARVSIFAGSQKESRNKVYYARWVEFGTLPHWIHVGMLSRPGRITRGRGGRPGEYKPWSLRTLNRSANRGGSLKIGQNFVGDSVHHPGAKRKPFLRPAMDMRAEEARRAIVEYIRKRLHRITSSNDASMKEAA